MESETRSSIYVAPLHIVKSTSGYNGHRPITSPTSLPQDHESRLLHQAQITPPPTPDGSNELSQEEPQSTGSASPTFLRAFYPFHSSDSSTSSTVTLSLNVGDIVLVHSIHTNGWADGTLLESGARGWLPTNYCEPYEHEPMRPLLHALTEFWDVIGTGCGSTLDISQKPDCMRGLVAGVRFLLEKAECLTRDSPIVKQHDNIRRSRKALLSDLSSLVRMVKHLKNAPLDPRNIEPNDAIFDNMLFKAFKIVQTGVTFLEIWNEDVALDRAIESVSSIFRTTCTGTQDNLNCLTPPLEHDDASSSNEDYSSLPAVMECRLSKTRREGLLAPMRDRSRPSSANSRGSWTSSSSARNRPEPEVRPTSTHSKRVSESHRASSRDQSKDSRNAKMATEKLGSRYDAFLSVLGSFLGLHMQSRSSWELLGTTQQAVKSCRELLGVIDLVWERDRRQSHVLLRAKDAMYDRITDLAHAARDIFQPLASAEEDMVFRSDDIKLLVNAATSCVRGAGECVAITGQVLEQIGDFELEVVEGNLRAARIDSVPSSTFNKGRSDIVRKPAPGFVGYEHVSGRMQQRADAPQLEIPQSSISAQKLSSSNSTSPSTDSNTIVYTPSNSSAAADITENCNDRSSFFRSAMESLSPLTLDAQSLVLESLTMPETLLRQQISNARNVVNSTGSRSTYISSPRDSKISALSSGSTRATSPEIETEHFVPNGVGRQFSAIAQTPAEVILFAEASGPKKSFTHELMYNKDDQIVGGSLPALIEALTAHHSTPDAMFVSTFYLTFRLFASPCSFAEALACRFEYIGEDPHFASPVRLRVYNVFKGWLESHWRHDCDSLALPFIMEFVRNTLAPCLPPAGKRLQELAQKVLTAHGPLVPRLVSSIGKTNTSIAPYINPDAPLPNPIISKSQLAALRVWRMGGATMNILDFEPIELARQITIKASSIFCSILPEELLATEWMKRSGSLAVNVRAMSTLSTDLANLVADTILQLEEPKKRATIIKHWVKIANRCFELHNYDSLMAIICALNSSTIARLRKTWDLVSQKTQAILDNLKAVVEVSRNYAALRQRLQNHVPPCLPFVGTYLTDLTFVDHGNPAARQLVTENGSTGLINYDKHMKTARIISELQRFQIPYRFTEVPELQTWMQDQLVQVRSSGEKNFQSYYRRSLLLEPREQQPQRKESSSGLSGLSSKSNEKDRFDFLAWTHTSKDKSSTTN